VVNYALIKSMGSALGWTDEDCVPLCEAYLEVTGDPVHGTSRTKDLLWASVRDVWTAKRQKKGTLRVNRNATALEKQFARIRNGVSLFIANYLAVEAMPTTGNLTEEDVISGAIARYCWLNVYKAIRADQEAGKQKGVTGKRKAKVAHCQWVACWRVLRQSDKFNGAASASASDTPMDVGKSTEEEEGSSGSGCSRRAGAFQHRPIGVKAAKAMRFEDLKMEKQVQPSASALDKLTDAQNERNALCLFDSPAMRDTPKAARYRAAVTRKMMERAGIPVESAPGGGPTGSEAARGSGVGLPKNTDDTAEDIGVMELSDGEPPGAGRASDGAARLRASAAAVSDAVAAAAAVVAMAAANKGRRLRRAAASGRKAQAAKQRKAAGSLTRKMRTTRVLDESRAEEASTTEEDEYLDIDSEV